MEKKASFYINSLDSGYTITENGKTSAFENGKSVEDYLVSRFKKLTERYGHIGINNMLISIDVMENCPTAG